MLKYYVGKVVATEDELVEVKFAKSVPSLNSQSSTFTWVDEDDSLVPQSDIVLALPRPNLLGRSNIIKFEIDFPA